MNHQMEVLSIVCGYIVCGFVGISRHHPGYITFLIGN